jgi:hypothetical protein
MDDSSTAQVAEKLGLARGYYHDLLFDAQGNPRPVGSSQSINWALGAPAVAWLDSLPRTPLTAALAHEYKGRPLAAPSMAELSAWLTAGTTAGSAASTAGLTGISARAPVPLEASLAAVLRKEAELFGALSIVQPGPKRVAPYDSDEARGGREAMLGQFRWVLDSLSSLRWPACKWPAVGVNPFRIKLTRKLCADYDVDGDRYFSLVREAMGLDHIGDRLEKGAYDSTKRGPEAFWEDLTLVARNAKVFNGPKEFRAFDTQDGAFPVPATLPPAFSASSGSLYGIAFEFQAAAHSLHSACTPAAQATAERLAHRRRARQMIAAREDAAKAAWYASPEMLATLQVASKAEAAASGVSSELTAYLIRTIV